MTEDMIIYMSKFYSLHVHWQVCLNISLQDIIHKIVPASQWEIFFQTLEHAKEIAV